MIKKLNNTRGKIISKINNISLKSVIYSLTVIKYSNSVKLHFNRK